MAGGVCGVCCGGWCVWWWWWLWVSPAGYGPRRLVKPKNVPLLGAQTRAALPVGATRRNSHFTSHLGRSHRISSSFWAGDARTQPPPLEEALRLPCNGLTSTRPTTSVILRAASSFIAHRQPQRPSSRAARTDLWLPARCARPPLRPLQPQHHSPQPAPNVIFLNALSAIRPRHAMGDTSAAPGPLP